MVLFFVIITQCICGSGRSENCNAPDGAAPYIIDCGYSGDAGVYIAERQPGASGAYSAMRLTAGSFSEFAWNYRIESGVPCGIYVVSMWIKTSDLRLEYACSGKIQDGGYGMTLSGSNNMDAVPARAVSIVVTDLSDYNREMVYSGSIETDARGAAGRAGGWIRLKRVVKLDKNGCLDFCMQAGGRGAKIAGTVCVDGVEVTGIDDDSEYTMYKSPDGAVRLVFYSSDVSAGATGGAISDILIKNQIDELAKTCAAIRKSIKIMIGGLEPYNGVTDIILTERHDYFGLAGNPIYINAEFAPESLQAYVTAASVAKASPNYINAKIYGSGSCADVAGPGSHADLLWALAHEISHTFDGVASESIDIRRTFDAELFADLKAFYALRENIRAPGAERAAEYAYARFKSFAPLSSGIYTKEGFFSKLLDIISSGDIVDCPGVLRNTFVRFNAILSEGGEMSNIEILTLLLDLLSEESALDFTYEFSEKEWTTVINNYG